VKLAAGVIAIFVLLHGSALALGSLRGESGVAVGALVVLASLLAQQALAHQPVRAAVGAIGLSRPTRRSLWAAAGVGVILLAVIPAYALATGAQPTMYRGWMWLLPGLFAQGGIAEEVLFRGYLFGNLRRRHAFWRAAMLSAGPFVAAHLLLFATMSWPLALASTLLALVASFPLAHLFEVGGFTIWAPALVHFIMQGAVKVVDMSGAPPSYPLAWVLACALVPWLAFAVRVPVLRG
jgi:membrane protease YdiL (CAAX protease family)